MPVCKKGEPPRLLIPKLWDKFGRNTFTRHDVTRELGQISGLGVVRASHDRYLEKVGRDAYKRLEYRIAERGLNLVGVSTYEYTGNSGPYKIKRDVPVSGKS